MSQMIGVVLYVAVDFVLPLVSKGVSGATGIVGDITGSVGNIADRFSGAGYADEYGQEF